MLISVVDAFGTEVGTATVQWHPVASELGTDGNPLSEETRSIFPEKTTVTLPARNPDLPWRLVVRP
jgi:hypothetical protein